MRRSATATLGDLLAALVARVTGRLLESVERRPFGVDHVAELLGNVFVHPAEVVAPEPVLAPGAAPVHQLADALDLFAVAVREARVQDPAQRRSDPRGRADRR